MDLEKEPNQAINRTNNNKYLKYIPLFITPLKQYKIIFRHKWLKQYNPSINWVKEILKFYITYCQSYYLKYYLPYKYAHNYLNLT